VAGLEVDSRLLLQAWLQQPAEASTDLSPAAAEQREPMGIRQLQELLGQTEPTMPAERAEEEAGLPTMALDRMALQAEPVGGQAAVAEAAALEMPVGGLVAKAARGPMELPGSFRGEP